MTYSLGNTKPWVAAVANSVGPRFGIKVIYGYSYRNIAGTTTLSDHARGLALDFMVGSDADKGNSLAQYMRENAAAYNVTYVIWNRHIWSVARNAKGWRAYDGVNPHTDHVHVSFRDLSSAEQTAWHVPIPGTDGSIPIPTPGDVLGGIGDGLSGAGGAIAGIPGDVIDSIRNTGKALNSIAKIVKLMLNPNTWVRWFMFLAGMWLLGIALYMIMRETNAGQAAGRAVSTAVKTAGKSAGKAASNAG